MAPESGEPTLEATTRELLAVLRDVEAAVEPPRPRGLVRPPTPRGLLEFTAEVGIPAAILVLRTNIAALELLQRTLRMMDGESDRTREGTQVRKRAVDLTSTTLSRLDETLADLQTAVDVRTTDRSPDELIAEARRRTEELEAQLSTVEGNDPERPLGGRGATEIDVDAELESLRESVDRDGDDDGPASPTDG